jgi:hypothetical protein
MAQRAAIWRGVRPLALAALAGAGLTVAVAWTLVAIDPALRMPAAFMHRTARGDTYEVMIARGPGREVRVASLGSGSERRAPGRVFLPANPLSKRETQLWGWPTRALCYHMDESWMVGPDATVPRTEALNNCITFERGNTVRRFPTRVLWPEFGISTGAYAMGLVLAAGAWRGGRAAWRGLRRRCLWCGYSLGGLAGPRVCPECSRGGAAGTT